MSLTKTIIKNSFSNWVGMVLNTVITLLLTPYLIRHLGDERYGIYQIVFPVVQYLILMELGLRGAVARFASKYIAADDIFSLNSVISTSFFMCLGLSTVVFLITFFLGLVAPSFFDISEQYARSTMYIFIGVGLNTICSFISFSFGGVLIGHNRYELINLQIVITSISRAVLVLIFFSFGWITLEAFAMAISLAAVAGVLVQVVSAFSIQQGLSIHLRYLNRKILKELFGFGVWNMVIQLSGFLILYANPIIIGRYLGPETVPYYAVPFMLVTRLQTVVMGITSTLMPIASSTLSTGDKTLMKKLLYKSTYVASLLVFPVGGVLLVMCKSLFEVWLPAGYESSWIIYAVLMIAFFGSISQSSSFFVLFGGGNIKLLSVVYLLAGMTSVLLSIYWVGYKEIGLIGAAWAVVIPRILSAFLFLAGYACWQIKVNIVDYFLKSYLKPVLCSLVSIVVAAGLIYIYPPSNLFVWILEFIGALVPFLMLGLIGFVELPMRERIVERIRCFCTSWT